MNEVIDVRPHRAKFTASMIRIVETPTLGASGNLVTKAQDSRLAAAKAKKAAEDSGLLYVLRSNIDLALTTARLEESRAKRLLLAECEALMQHQQAESTFEP